MTIKIIITPHHTVKEERQRAGDVVVLGLNMKLSSLAPFYTESPFALLMDYVPSLIISKLGLCISWQRCQMNGAYTIMMPASFIFTVGWAVQEWVRSPYY